MLPLPRHAQRVRAILNHDDAALLADRGDFVHVAHLAAHVAYQAELGAALVSHFRQVLRIHQEVVRAFHVHRLAARVHDRGRHRGEGEGVRQHFVARLGTHALESHEDCASARVQRHAVLVPRVVRQRLLAPRDHARLVGLSRVAVQLAALHQLRRQRDALLRDRVRGLDALAQDRLLRLDAGIVDHCHLQPTNAAGAETHRREACRRWLVVRRLK
mmetsp:Transcript_65453/g.156136  ORF Transcript_65453/g.156136 Transcript_65453/m.156136 type:complete len:216 (+) Transcript_65453:1164-1811(+)